ncbi:MAG: hypothetical protein ACNFW9_01890 [Candidatus Kerfeldbacteria bacterium]|jgi:multisubunit Na+/H+ antiporter MnhB subunit
MKNIFSNIDTKKLTTKYLGSIIYSIIVIIFAIVGYFTYQNLYLTSISPKPIDENDIIAKKQKVNLILFEKITTNISEKKDQNYVVKIPNLFE